MGIITLDKSFKFSNSCIYHDHLGSISSWLFQGHFSEKLCQVGRAAILEESRILLIPSACSTLSLQICDPQAGILLSSAKQSSKTGHLRAQTLVTAQRISFVPSTGAKAAHSPVKTALS